MRLFENKIVLAIAIPIVVERFMADKIADNAFLAGIRERQTQLLPIGLGQDIVSKGTRGRLKLPANFLGTARSFGRSPGRGADRSPRAAKWAIIGRPR